MKTQKIICVSHEPPLVPEKFFDYVIGLGEYQPQRGAHVSELDPFWDRMRPLAYGAAGNYVIPRAIEREAPVADLHGVFSHRKIVVRNPTGQPAAKFPAFREISIAAALELPITEVRPQGGHEFLLGPPLLFPQGIIRQYAEKHHVLDLLDYLSIAVKIGVLTSREVSEFALDNAFIPGGCELGIYPTAWLYATLKKLEAVGREFIDKWGERIRTYDRYQVRAVGFLAERLGSYFLLKELRKRYPQGAPRSLFGCICVVAAGGESYQGALAQVPRVNP